MEAGLITLNTLPSEKQEEVLRALFDLENGAGYTAMKTPLGGTDFQSAGPWFTYDDTPGDAELKIILFPVEYAKTVEEIVSKEGPIESAESLKQISSLTVSVPTSTVGELLRKMLNVTNGGENLSRKRRVPPKTRTSSHSRRVGALGSAPKSRQVSAIGT